MYRYTDIFGNLGGQTDIGNLLNCLFIAEELRGGCSVNGGTFYEQRRAENESKCEENQ
mgnify:CR=1 FL=1